MHRCEDWILIFAAGAITWFWEVGAIHESLLEFLI